MTVLVRVETVAGEGVNFRQKKKNHQKIAEINYLYFLYSTSCISSYSTTGCLQVVSSCSTVSYRLFLYTVLLEVGVDKLIRSFTILSYAGSSLGCWSGMEYFFI